MPNVNGSTLAAPAARVLTTVHTSLIRRKAVIKAVISRLEKLEKQINDKLYPKIDEELQAQREDVKATVAVNTVIVEVKHVVQPMPKTAEVLKHFATEDQIVDLLATHPELVTNSDRYFAKLVGRNTTFEQLLR